MEGFERTDMRRLVRESAGLIHDQVSTAVHATTVPPKDAKAVLNTNWSAIKKGEFDGFKVLTAVSPHLEYEDDDRLKSEMARNASHRGGTVKLGNVDIDTPQRNYELHPVGSSQGFIIVNYKDPHVHDYQKLHLGGYNIITEWFEGIDESYLKWGIMEQVRGRDVMITSFLLAIPDIIKLMKARLLRNIGV